MTITTNCSKSQYPINTLHPIHINTPVKKMFPLPAYPTLFIHQKEIKYPTTPYKEVSFTLIRHPVSQQFPAEKDDSYWQI